MFDPFEVKDRTGNVVRVICKRHQGLCWRLLFFSAGGEELGDLLFEPEARTSVRLCDFNVFPEYARNGIGTGVLKKFLELLRTKGFKSVTALCKSSERPLAEKEGLARWYGSFGFTLARETLAEEPGYMGKLHINL